MVAVNGRIDDNVIMTSVLNHAMGGDHSAERRLNHGILCADQISLLNGLLLSLGLLALWG